MAGPGILFVNSKIVDPSSLPEALFHEWYETVHIPDIFQTSMDTAIRYKSTRPDAERPWLARYPVKDTDFFQSTEFRSIPVISDILPGPNKCCFDYADFDTRYYSSLEKSEAESAEGYGEFLTTVAFDAPSTAHGDLPTWFQMTCVPSFSKCEGFKRGELFKLLLARQNRLKPEEKKIPDPPQYLIMIESDGAEVPPKVVEELQLPSLKMAPFSQLKIFRK